MSPEEGGHLAEVGGGGPGQHLAHQAAAGADSLQDRQTRQTGGDSQHLSRQSVSHLAAMLVTSAVLSAVSRMATLRSTSWARDIVRTWIL